MKTLVSTLALIAGLSLAGTSLAQPSGGPDAKGNAPLKAVHTVNDGTAKRGANSFTEGQARQHILNSGFTAVTGLVKGKDGVWRGSAMKAGASTNVAMDFKGNVSEDTSAPAAAVAPRSTHTQTTTSQMGTQTSATTGEATDTTTTTHHMHRHHMHRHHWRHHHSRCVNPGPNGVACSGIDRNKNGVSDKEDRALAH